MHGEVLTGSGAWNNIAYRGHGCVGIDARGGGHVTVGWTASGHHWNNGSLRDENSGAVGSANDRGSGNAGLVGWDLGANLSWSNISWSNVSWSNVSWRNLNLSSSWSWHWCRSDWKLNAVKDLELWRVVDVAIAIINLQVVGAFWDVGLWGPDVVGARKLLCKCVSWTDKVHVTEVLTTNGAEQHLVAGVAVLQQESNGTALRLSSPGDLERDTCSDTTVVGVGQADQGLSKGGKAGGTEEDLSGIHLEDLVYRRVLRV